MIALLAVICGGVWINHKFTNEITGGPDELNSEETETRTINEEFGGLLSAPFGLPIMLPAGFDKGRALAARAYQYEQIQGDE